MATPTSSTRERSNARVYAHNVVATPMANNTMDTPPMRNWAKRFSPPWNRDRQRDQEHSRADQVESNDACAGLVRVIVRHRYSIILPRHHGSASREVPSRFDSPS